MGSYPQTGAFVSFPTHLGPGFRVQGLGSNVGNSHTRFPDIRAPASSQGTPIVPVLAFYLAVSLLKLNSCRQGTLLIQDCGT